MPMVGRGHAHGVDRFHVQQLPHVGHDAVRRDPQRLGHRITAAHVDVAHVGHFDVGRVLEQPGVVRPAATAADQADHQLVVGAPGPPLAVPRLKAVAATTPADVSFRNVRRSGLGMASSPGSSNRPLLLPLRVQTLLQLLRRHLAGGAGGGHFGFGRPEQGVEDELAEVLRCPSSCGCARR